ncbi:hypothetical protein WN51_14180 [Melipona quadrifasciata]|uniref:Uncharacterized protein n=1 Tax=Melipona quadrifasciata TaxID=166423 RepID=A0A0M8ZZ67_9HYME|nr:hypothetical protein WN51_14180 [Melipona quadrifasciata]
MRTSAGSSQENREAPARKLRPWRKKSRWLALARQADKQAFLAHKRHGAARRFTCNSLAPVGFQREMHRSLHRETPPGHRRGDEARDEENEQLVKQNMTGKVNLAPFSFCAH